MENEKGFVRRFHHIAIAVRDIEKSKAFYGSVLNLQPISRPDFGFKGAWYRVGDQELHLIQDDVTLNQRQHFAIEVSDIRMVFGRLKKHNIPIISPPGKRPHDHSGFMFCQDPDGNLIEITHHD